MSSAKRKRNPLHKWLNDVNQYLKKLGAFRFDGEETFTCDKNQLLFNIQVISPPPEKVPGFYVPVFGKMEDEESSEESDEDANEESSEEEEIVDTTNKEALFKFLSRSYEISIKDNIISDCEIEDGEFHVLPYRDDIRDKLVDFNSKVHAQIFDGVSGRLYVDNSLVEEGSITVASILDACKTYNSNRFIYMNVDENENAIYLYSEKAFIDTSKYHVITHQKLFMGIKMTKTDKTPVNIVAAGDEDEYIAIEFGNKNMVVTAVARGVFKT